MSNIEHNGCLFLLLHSWDLMGIGNQIRGESVFSVLSGFITQDHFHSDLIMLDVAPKCWEIHTPSKCDL